MTQQNEHVIACVRQSLEDAASLYKTWSEPSTSMLTYTHLVEARRLCHRIAGSCLTFNVENIASIARVCEHVITQTLEDCVDEQSVISLTQQDHIATLLKSLHSSCVNTWAEMGEQATRKDDLSAVESTLEMDTEKDGFRVLVADDDPVMQAFVKRKLESRGFVVSVAEDGEQAVSMTNNLMPNVVLMDGLMPKLDGFEALEQIKKNEKTAHIAVFMLTALDEQENVAESIAYGADAYFIKPFNMEEVVEKIKQACAVPA